MQDLVYADVEVRLSPTAVIQSDLVVMMKSVAKLSSARRAAVLQRDTMTNLMSVRAHSHPDDSGTLDFARHILLPAPGETRWIHLQGRDRATILLVGLRSAGYDDGRLWLMLSFGEHAAHDMIERLLPAILELLAMHLALEARLEQTQRQRRAAIAALQQNECGIIVVRADRTVLLCNAAADAILAAEDVVTLRGDTLRLTNYRDALRLNTAIDCVVEGVRATTRGRQGGIVMLLTRPQSSRPLIAAVTPATGTARDEAAAIIYLLSPDQNVMHGLGPICSAHGLSQVETRLVTHLLNGATITEAAVDMRIKPSTARGYLKQVFAKTNSHRQVDLVQLFTRYLRAVRGDFDFQPG